MAPSEHQIYQHIQLTKWYDPHDVSSLLLVLFYALGTIAIKPDILLRVLDPTGIRSIYAYEKDLDLNATIKLPNLECLVQFLIDADEEAAALTLIAALEQIPSMHGLIQLLTFFKNRVVIDSMCDIPDPYFKRGISKKSVFYMLLSRKFRGFTDIYLSGDMTQKWRELHSYRAQFKTTKLWQAVNTKLPQKSAFLGKVFNESDDNTLPLPTIQTGEEEHHVYPWILTTRERYEQLVNMELTKLNSCTNPDLSIAEELVRYTSLNQKTTFPSVLMVQYTISLLNKNYQESQDLLFRIFDYAGSSFESSQTYDSASGPLFNSFMLSHLFRACGTPQAAVKRIENVVKLVREHGSLTGVQPMLYSLFIFLKDYPHLSDNLQSAVAQLKKYFENTARNSLNSIKFLYSIESLLQLTYDAHIPQGLANAYKTRMLCMLDDKSRHIESVDPFIKTTEIWNRIGIEEIPPCYATYANTSSDFSNYRGAYSEVVQSLVSGDDAPLYSLDIGAWPYSEQQKVKQLKIRYLKKLGELDEAMNLVNVYIEDTRSKIIDKFWEFEFMKEKVYLLFECGMAARSINFITEMIGTAEKAKNAYQLTQCFILLSTALVALRKYDMAVQLMRGNMYTVFQFGQRELEKEFMNKYIEAMRNATCQTKGVTIDQLQVLQSKYMAA
ncbi:AAL094Wp [Eremothecium gossypii ATCC 10895]|uniref:Anaphase-promoting complex subunit 5 n=1 Tax=Eremothecium gossypii (strain ATCC 10895 / CBS 109.51 / FGSC 9923 / NRRL Y-1056) TaxID=284811 RepID=Q75F22_EREGS|nr:AAL094Wp [Eremothecium gossypii ATCC 10895]AAS50272.1 AAL094Wp [Eremothecium gossypii ATCC 10895]AEY94557.1 FAAL094Wp [Eremothecium gossypii FDAG1]